jgi:hypothetical protein
MYFRVVLYRWKAYKVQQMYKSIIVSELIPYKKPECIAHDC